MKSSIVLRAVEIPFMRSPPPKNNNFFFVFSHLIMRYGLPFESEVFPLKTMSTILEETLPSSYGHAKFLACE